MTTPKRHIVAFLLTALVFFTADRSIAQDALSSDLDANRRVELAKAATTALRLSLDVQSSDLDAINEQFVDATFDTIETVTQGLWDEYSATQGDGFVDHAFVFGKGDIDTIATGVTGAYPYAVAITNQIWTLDKGLDSWGSTTGYVAATWVTAYHLNRFAKQYRAEDLPLMGYGVRSKNSGAAVVAMELVDSLATNWAKTDLATATYSTAKEYLAIASARLADTALRALTKPFSMATRQQSDTASRQVNATHEILGPEEIHDVFNEYGSLPGGILLTSSPNPRLHIVSAAYIEHVNTFVINDTLYLAPRISGTEVREILLAVEQDNRLGIGISPAAITFYGAIGWSHQVARTLAAGDLLLSSLALGQPSVSTIYSAASGFTPQPHRGDAAVLVRLLSSGFLPSGDELVPHGLTVTISLIPTDWAPGDQATHRTRWNPSQLKSVEHVTDNFRYYSTERAIAKISEYAIVADLARRLKQEGIDLSQLVGTANDR